MTGAPRAPGSTSARASFAISASSADAPAKSKLSSRMWRLLHQLVGNRRRQEADRRADAGVRRHQHARKPELLGDARGMQRRRAAERDQRVVVHHLAALDRMHARRARHVLAHHLVHRVGRGLGDEPERIADRRGERGARQLRIERDRAAREGRRIDHAERHVRVGDGRPHAATPIAGRARLRARAFRPDGHALERIDMRDRAAARADLHHLDHRNAHRQAGAFQEARRAIDFVDARRIRLEILDQADLRRGAAHVERQHLLLGPARGHLRRRRSRRPPARTRSAAPESAARCRSRSARRRT